MAKKKKDEIIKKEQRGTDPEWQPGAKIKVRSERARAFSTTLVGMRDIMNTIAHQHGENLQRLWSELEKEHPTIMAQYEVSFNHEEQVLEIKGKK